MCPFDVSVHVLEGFESLVSAEWLKQVAEQALAVEAPGPGARLNVVIADDAVVRDLNKRHRGLDENTDVLSFSFIHRGEYLGEHEPRSHRDEETDFVLPPGEEKSLGEVIISYPQALRQAEQSGHPIAEELALLLTHGVLHLLGHDHEEPKEEAAMKRTESEVLARVEVSVSRSQL